MGVVRRFLSLVLLGAVALTAWAQSGPVDVIVEISRPSSPGLIGLPYCIKQLIFTRDGSPIGTFTIIPPVVIPDGGVKELGPYTLPQVPNGLIISGGQGQNCMTPLYVTFTGLTICTPQLDPATNLRVHLKQESPPAVVFPLPLPTISPIDPFSKQAEDILAMVNAAVDQAIVRFGEITNLNRDIYRWLGTKDSLIIVVPAKEFENKSGTIVGLLGIKSRELSGFYALALDPLPPLSPSVKLVDERGREIRQLSAFISPEARKIGKIVVAQVEIQKHKSICLNDGNGNPLICITIEDLLE